MAHLRPQRLFRFAPAQTDPPNSSARTLGGGIKSVYSDTPPTRCDAPRHRLDSAPMTRRMTKKKKPPLWMRRRVDDPVSAVSLNGDARARIAKALLIEHHGPEVRDAVLNAIDDAVQRYRDADRLKAAYPSAGAQRESIAELRNAVLQVQTSGDPETRKRLYLHLGKGRGRRDGRSRFDAGKRRLQRMLDDTDRAINFAERRSYSEKRGPNKYVPLTALIHELADIWETMTTIPFGSSKPTDPDKDARNTQKPRRFVVAVLSAGKCTVRDDILNRILKKVKRERVPHSPSDDSDASDDAYGYEAE